MHNYKRMEFNVKDSKNDIYKECEAFARRDGDGLFVKNINFYDEVMNSYNEADSFLDKHHKEYSCEAVKYKETPYISESVLEKNYKYKALSDKYNETLKKYISLKNNIYYKDVKSAFVSCKKCGSKFNTKLIYFNKCPLCENDLRPETALNKLKMLKENIDKLRGAMNEVRDDIIKKLNYEIKEKWLVLIEYHS